MAKGAGGWGLVPDKRPIVGDAGDGLLLMVANMSIEPIITVYVAQFVPVVAGDVRGGAGHVGGGAGEHISASQLGGWRTASGIGNLVVCLAVCGLC